MDNKQITVTSPLLPNLDEFHTLLKVIWDSKWITNNGSFHQKLEAALAEYLKVPYVSLFTNGTLPLLTALQALRITGEVITTPYSFVATTHSIWWNGCKPVFVDVTGHGCVNCREMESRVWSAPAVLEKLRNDFVVVALYVDDKYKLAKEDWVTDETTGDVYKDLGRANSYIARSKWNVNAQPNYVLLSPDGEVLVPVRGYDLSIEGFIAFLQSGLDAYKSR